jgi:hypothetical protein
MYKVKIKDPTREGKILYFTCEKYELGENTISFQDREGLKQVWHISQLINIEQTELNEGEF